MNKALELRSAVARQEAERRLNLEKSEKATILAEKEEEQQLRASKTARLRALRLAREAALREALEKMPVPRPGKRS